MSSKEIEKAMHLINEKRIFRMAGLPDLFVVTGTKDDYLVIPPAFCSCEHFNFRCIRTADKVCYHILAVRMAENVPKRDDFSWEDILFREH